MRRNSGNVLFLEYLLANAMRTPSQVEILVDICPEPNCTIPGDLGHVQNPTPDPFLPMGVSTCGPHCNRQRPR